MNSSFCDVWSEWLLHGRFGGYESQKKTIQSEVTQYADRIFDAAKLTAGMTLADIGTGDGLVAFRALERIGSSLNVLMMDISEPLLHHTEKLAVQKGVEHQCTFCKCSADSLTGIPDRSVVVTTRAVLAYVPNKVSALREFYRILKPGGRISIAEPILRDEAVEVCALRKMVEERDPGFSEPFFPLLHRYRSAQFPDTLEKVLQMPITNYGERDLVRFAIEAGFTDLHLELHIDVQPAEIQSWDVFVHTSPHPWPHRLAQFLIKNSPPKKDYSLSQYCAHQSKAVVSSVNLALLT